MHYFKVFIELVATLLLFDALIFFYCEACGILAPDPGIKPALLAGEISNTGPRSPLLTFVFNSHEP